MEDVGGWEEVFLIRNKINIKRDNLKCQLNLIPQYVQAEPIDEQVEFSNLVLGKYTLRQTAI